MLRRRSRAGCGGASGNTSFSLARMPLGKGLPMVWTHGMGLAGHNASRERTPLSCLPRPVFVFNRGVVPTVLLYSKYLLMCACSGTNTEEWSGKRAGGRSLPHAVAGGGWGERAASVNRGAEGRTDAESAGSKHHGTLRKSRSLAPRIRCPSYPAGVRPSANSPVAPCGMSRGQGTGQKTGCSARSVPIGAAILVTMSSRLCC